MPLGTLVFLGSEDEVEEELCTTYVPRSCTYIPHDNLPLFVFNAQDLGNTNFSIHLPRLTFDRHLTAQVVLRAVRSLGIDANVNERNDICVGKEKIRSTSYTSTHWYLNPIVDAIRVGLRIQDRE